MKILGIETSCDETAAAVVEDGTKILSNVVASQIDIHSEFGGVVPEVAARSHLEVILPIIEKSLAEAKIEWNGIDGIAVTTGPGLIGSLLVGTLAARTLAEIKGKPLYTVDHVEAHVYANFLIKERPDFPLLALIVSGGHTQLVLFEGHGVHKVLGRTLDDAAGEAFDKTAKILGLPYPGGPSVAAAAENGDDRTFTLPKPKLGKDSLDFSFSGLKTAVLRASQTAAGGDFRTPSIDISAFLSQKQKNDLAASFQKTVVDILSDRVSQAVSIHRPASIAVVGGVAANQTLRQELSQRISIPLHYAPINLCTDNAAMIASLGYFASLKTEPTSPYEVKVNPILAM